MKKYYSGNKPEEVLMSGRDLITSFYGSSCVNNGKGALNTPDIRDSYILYYTTVVYSVYILYKVYLFENLFVCIVGLK